MIDTMNIKIDSDFRFSVVSIQYTATGQLSISLTSDGFSTNAHYQYSASLGSGQATNTPPASAAGKLRRNRPSACCNTPKLSPLLPISNLKPKTPTASCATTSRPTETPWRVFCKIHFLRNCVFSKKHFTYFCAFYKKHVYLQTKILAQ